MEKSPMSDTAATHHDPDDPLYDDEDGGRWYNRLGRTSRGYANKLLIIMVLVLFATIYYWPAMFHTIPSGHVGVLFLRFGGGTQTDRVFGEGLKIIAPWDRLFIYEVRVQEVRHEFDVLTQEGLKLKLHLSIRYHPQPDLAGLLHERIGPDYKDKVVIPEVESALRFTIAGFPMQDVYGAQRTLVQEAVNSGLESVEQKYVKVDEVVLREIELPPQIREVIEQKMTQKELAESYAFRLQVAEREAQRLLIEANGLKAYNDTLNTSLTPDILRWAGIEATKALATSANSKTVVIGSGPNGLPLILGGGQ
jgi:regulator of protease activity HflC (stomatin/prohibitin superfamily)